MCRVFAAVTLMTVTIGGRAHAAGSDPQSPEADAWFGPDKALHFGVSAGLAAVAYAGSSLVFEDRSARLMTGAGVALTIGVAKELNDLAGHGDPSWKDLTWDVIGTATGLAIAYVVDRFVITPAARGSGAASGGAGASKQPLAAGVHPAGVGLLIVF